MIVVLAKSVVGTHGGSVGSAELLLRRAVAGRGAAASGQVHFCAGWLKSLARRLLRGQETKSYVQLHVTARITGTKK